ncbi:TIGR00341 family protein [Longibacter salinarum]|uniref:TIGR00341 family protein n=1 Tax=Longibacter salinarum TaxID=1850348 RepID=A0A2A8CZP0_9BACT|nr:TIGR00341 family protein [Longibacter salinarum]PEN14145.1 TIGR00341 family protein [Longibacter salinarum]
MPTLRSVDIIQPPGQQPIVIPNDDFELIDHWQVDTTTGRHWTHVVLRSAQTEAFTDWVNNHVGEDVRIVWSAVEATHPRIDMENNDNGDGNEDNGTTSRIDREELYQYARESVGVSAVFLAMVVLSTVVAAGGMLRNNVAVVIGAMVIAPLIGPNIALALGTTLGDTALLRRAVSVNLAGVGLVLFMSMLLGAVVTIDASIPELASRTDVHMSDVALALAAGAAGTLAVTRGVSTALVGVMVAVALLPPLVACGLFLGSGQTALAGSAAVLTMTNVVCINLAGVSTFLVQGVRPRHWTEMEKARASTRVAMTLWVVMLLALGGLIWFLR